MDFRVELDGAPVTTEDLVAAMGNYGHFTAMQVRGGRVRGLELHLDRLVTSTRRLFASELDTDRLLVNLRRVIKDEDALSVRVLVFTRALNWDDPGAPAAPEVLIRTGPPQSPEPKPLRLRSVRYERVLPEVKHVGTFGIVHHIREAKIAGYDDALFLDNLGRVSEASIWNVGFLEGGKIVWPEAPVLPGITLQLLRKGLRRQGIPQETREVYPADLPGFDAMFVTNSQTSGTPVISVDDVELRSDPDITRLLMEAYETNPRDEI
ncbi:aminotransferase class IV family protein [Amycolatopsis sp. H20-H5]|uniref:aminotransferase class IV family protein n=1 Tax=Amycolatopsis sp. H20-H5 TaxID=3046309 RepID=UPI002DBF308E|nr:aminotransferase class IV family protein [Amycolatopsis sp. H20-H5]MEC3976734.1 aminotransferase class IV family protein [Amycolatopsis sp. H20-H5]